MTVHCLFVAVLFLLTLSHLMPSVVGHARLLYPPSRASMWRFGFTAPIDYNDNEGFCGGAAVLHEIYNGKCGVCGDVWDPIPRAHERGGSYYAGTVSATLKAGDVITAVVHVTANHKGFFEFRVCPYDNPEAGDLEMDATGKMVEVSQSCLDKHLLRVENGQGTKLYLNSSDVGFYNASLKLPEDLHCNKCLFQWRYKTGNSWGIDENGNSCLGCGNQEEFKACADVIIKPFERESTVTPMTTTTQESGTSTEDITTDSTKGITTDSTKDITTDSTKGITTSSTKGITTGSTKGITTDSTETTTDNPVTTPSSSTYQTTTSHANQRTTTAGTGSCRPTSVYARVPGMTQWCIVNCNAGYCPASHCVCNTP